MRDFKGMKRQRGRNRGGGGGKPQHNANRAFESNGPDGVKVRGQAQAIFERYQQLARDAASSGDRVLAENYLQHAEHYFRTLRAMQPQRPVSEIYGRDQYSSGFDIDFEAEPTEQTAEEGAEQTADEGGEGEGQREERQRDDRQQRDRWENRDRQRDDRQRDDRPRDGEQRREGEGRRERFDRRDRWRDREDRQRGDRGDQPREQAASETAPAPAPAEQNAPVLRSEDGEVSHAPAFLGRASEAPRDSAETPAPKPRRRRAPRSENPAPETEEA
jgi:hypothetical protein